MLKLHCLLHVPFEGPAYINDWVKEKNHGISFTKFYMNQNPPKIDDFDWLIIMGGPMNIYEEEKYPWLIKEKEFIKEAIKKGKVVIGICLGSQLIADALGSRVYKNENKEIGWFPVQLTKSAKHHPLFKFLPNEINVFHWHGETFNLPKDAIHLAESKACKNQMFIYKQRVIGIQFHLEMTKKSIEEIIENCQDELQQNIYVQTAEEIKNQMDYSNQCNNLMKELLDKLENSLSFES
ncbi:MAG: type 1 glutamine amidotransferase [Ignavibacteriales bacterium]|nr:type 1 glutamine amidotransferase [Ignavibacteriales bacterium]